MSALQREHFRVRLHSENRHCGSGERNPTGAEPRLCLISDTTIGDPNWGFVGNPSISSSGQFITVSPTALPGTLKNENVPSRG
jgi:hypothetical protein